MTDIQVLGYIGRHNVDRGERVLHEPSPAEVADLLTELCTPSDDPRWWNQPLVAHVGATDGVDPNDGDPVAQVQALTGGRGVDYAFEVIGLPETTLQAYNMIRKGGTAVMVGMTRAEAQLTISTFDLFFNEKTLKGCKY